MSAQHTPAPDGYTCAAEIPGHPYSPTNATVALQGALDTGADKIWVPDMGTDWVINPITLRSNQEILFESGVTVRAKAEGLYLTDGYLFRGSNISNTTLKGYGVTFMMLKDDYLSPPYTPSEHRHGIILYDTNNVKLIGMTIKDTGGDGIMVGTIQTGGYCDNTTIRDVTIDNCYRNGISVASANNLIIDGCVIANTNGTSPQEGIDFEPDFSDQRITNAHVLNTVIHNNAWSGISYPTSGLLTNGGAVGIPITGSIENCTIINNGHQAYGGGGTSEEFGDGIYMKWHLDGVTVKDNLLINNGGWGFQVDGYSIGYLQEAQYSAFWGNGYGPVGRQAGLGTGCITYAEPVFVSTALGNPGYMYLHSDTPGSIKHGGTDGGYMGARPAPIGSVAEIEDFESYTPDTVNNWTGSASWTPAEGWMPVYNAHGWAASGSNLVWPDGGYEIPSPQVLRRNDPNTTGNALFWNQAADIISAPLQTIEVKHRGLQQDAEGYGRVIVGNGANKVEYDNWTGGTGVLNGTLLPANNVGWTFGTGYSYDWFVTQIEFDYSRNLMRARFGQVQGDVWNDWTDWQAMTSTAQPTWVEIQLNGRIEIDDVVFTASPAAAGTGMWNVDASGSWHDPLNWTSMPVNNAHTATFGSVITEDTIVYTETDVTAAGIVFDNVSKYLIVGAGAVNLEADSGNATIDVLAGSHEFQAKVVLLADTDVDVNDGALLTFKNALDLNGFDLNLAGSGVLRIENLILSSSGGTITNTGSGTLVVTDKNGDGITDLEELALLAHYWLN